MQDTIFFMALLFILFILIVYSSINGLLKNRKSVLAADDKDRHIKRKFFERETTDSIRGIAIIIIMFAHIVQALGDQLVIQLPRGGIIRAVVIRWGALGVAIFFLLSGYGNSSSLIKIFEGTKANSKACGKILNSWLCKKLLKLLISFIICFVFVMITMQIFKVQNLTSLDFFTEFVQLKIPDCSTWYLKIQIILYLFIVLSFIAGIVLRENIEAGNRKYPPNFSLFFLLLLTLSYYVVAEIILKLPDYWWKTSLCFWVGSLLYFYRNTVEDLLFSSDRLRYRVKVIIDIITMALILFLSFSYTFIPFKNTLIYTLFLLIAQAGSALSVCTLSDIFKIRSALFKKIGNISLELYLIHIGLMSLFNWVIPQTLLKWSVIIHIIIFIALSFALSILANLLSRKIYLIILSKADRH